MKISLFSLFAAASLLSSPAQANEIENNQSKKSYEVRTQSSTSSDNATKGRFLVSVDANPSTPLIEESDKHIDFADVCVSYRTPVNTHPFLHCGYAHKFSFGTNPFIERTAIVVDNYYAFYGEYQLQVFKNARANNTLYLGGKAYNHFLMETDKKNYINIPGVGGVIGYEFNRKTPVVFFVEGSANASFLPTMAVTPLVRFPLVYPSIKVGFGF